IREHRINRRVTKCDRRKFLAKDTFWRLLRHHAAGKRRRNLQVSSRCEEFRPGLSLSHRLDTPPALFFGARLCSTEESYSEHVSATHVQLAGDEADHGRWLEPLPADVRISQ